MAFFCFFVLFVVPTASSSSSASSALGHASSKAEAQPGSSRQSPQDREAPTGSPATSSTTTTSKAQNGRGGGGDHHPEVIAVFGPPAGEGAVTGMNLGDVEGLECRYFVLSPYLYL